MKIPTIILTMILVQNFLCKSLHELNSSTLEEIRKKLDEETLKIINRIYPTVFTEKYNEKQYSFMSNFIYPKRYLEFKTLDLSNLNINRIPSTITGKFRQLETLDLSGNPNLILNEDLLEHDFLENLKELKIRNRFFTNDELLIISEMTSLISLDLSSSKNINIEILYPVLENLKHLDVSDCSLSYKQLEYILDHSNKLKSLNFSRNNLSNDINLFSILLNKPDLKILKLSECNLEFDVCKRIILELKHLKELDLSGNILSYQDQENAEVNTEIDEYVEQDKQDTKPSKLKKLNLNGCKLDNKDLTLLIFDIEGLQVLKLEENFLDFDMKEILQGKARNTIFELYLRNSNISNFSILEGITNFKCLRNLDISYNYFTNIPSKFSFKNLKKTLKTLNLENNDLNSGIINALSECSSLENLNLNRIDFTSIKISECCDISSKLNAISECHSLQNRNLNSLDLSNIELSGCCSPSFKESLKELKCSDSKMTYAWFDYFMQCPKLEKIDFSNNNFSLFPDDFTLGQSKENLTEIYLDKTNFTLNGLFDITDCPKLEILNINGNNFKDLPNDFKFGRSIKSLKQLYANNSKANHQFLQAVTAFEKLDTLIISNNYFNNIPNTFDLGNLKNSLKFLDISSSNLNNNCLLGILKLRKLEKLDISVDGFLQLSQDFNLGNCTNTLKSLKIQILDSNDNIFKAILECTNLEELSISNFDFSFFATMRDNECALKHSLKKFITISSTFNHAGFNYLLDFPKLELVKFYNPVFTDLSQKYTLGNSKSSLIELYLANSKMNGKLLFEISDCPKLKILNMIDLEKIDIDENFNFGRSRDSLIEINLVSHVGDFDLFRKSISENPRLKSIFNKNTKLN